MNTHVPNILNSEQVPEQVDVQQIRANTGLANESGMSSNGHIGRNGLEFVSAGRETVEFEKASRHSGRVRWLKIILPAIAAVVVVGFIGAIVLRNIGLPSINIGALNLDDGKLVMEHPKLNGTDSNQRPFSLTAEKAIQDLSTPKSIELDVITAKLPMENDVYADVTADNGVYDSEKKTLVLDGKVTLKTDGGMEINLTDVDVDIGAGSLQTSNPVRLKTENATIKADSLKVENNGERIIFETRVRMTLYPSSAKEPSVNGQ
ncbi:MAG: LPS export ABC transporter periplasmic protein LptC [Rhizobiaceae bacterium]